MKTKTYTVTMFPAVGKPRFWRCEAKSLDEAAFRFHGTRNRAWMTAFIKLDGSNTSYDVDGFSRIGRIEWNTPTKVILPHFGGQGDHRYEGGACVYCGEVRQ